MAESKSERLRGSVKYISAKNIIFLAKDKKKYIMNLCGF